MHWIYYVIGGILVIVALIVFIIYRGYRKIRPEPLKGIPCPPISNPVLGHPELTIHPFKHVARLMICDQTKTPLHQAVLMKNASIFINDSQEAGRIAKDCPTKGSIYTVFRYKAAIPDIFTCDGEDYLKRSQALEMTWEKLLADSSINQEIINNFLTHLDSLVNSTNTVQLDKMCTLLAFDLVAKHLFAYEMNSLNGQQQPEGQRLYDCVQIFVDGAMNRAIYKFSNVRQVSTEDVDLAKKDWQNFLIKIREHIKQLAEQSDYQDHLLSKLVKLAASDESIGEDGLLSEIHQLFTHSYECIAGSLMWIVYILARYPKLRGQVEEAVLEYKKLGGGPILTDEEGSYPEYLECFLKEVLRRHPVAGNFTVRTSTGSSFPLVNGMFEAPADVPLHLNMYCLQNTMREWSNAHEILPERWQNSTTSPTCPFASFFGKASNKRNASYDGLGFKEHALSFFPFSVGRRACKGKDLVLDILRRFIFGLASSYHLNFSEAKFLSDVDNGISLNFTIVPAGYRLAQLKVVKILDLTKVVAKEAGGLSEEENKSLSEGWAEEEE